MKSRKFVYLFATVVSFLGLSGSCGAFSGVEVASVSFSSRRRRQHPTSSLLQQQHRHFTYQPLHNLSSSNEEQDGSEEEVYNDDAFGLVFLCGAFVAEDAVFATTFLLLSAAAAISVRNSRAFWAEQTSVDTKYFLPSIVAGVALTVTLLVEKLNLFPSMILPSAGNPQATTIVVGVCTASIIYGIARSSSR